MPMLPAVSTNMAATVERCKKSSLRCDTQQLLEPFEQDADVRYSQQLQKTGAHRLYDAFVQAGWGGLSQMRAASLFDDRVRGFLGSGARAAKALHSTAAELAGDGKAAEIVAGQRKSSGRELEELVWLCKPLLLSGDFDAPQVMEVASNGPFMHSFTV